jgi:hypothetical protein
MKKVSDGNCGCAQGKIYKRNGVWGKFKRGDIFKKCLDDPNCGGLTYGPRGYDYFMKSGSATHGGPCGYVDDTGPYGLYDSLEK